MSLPGAATPLPSHPVASCSGTHQRLIFPIKSEWISSLAISALQQLSTPAIRWVVGCCAHLSARPVSDEGLSRKEHGLFFPLLKSLF